MNAAGKRGTGEEKNLSDTEIEKLLTSILVGYTCTFDSSQGLLKFQRAQSQLNDLTRKLTELEKNGVFKLISVGPIENEDVYITIHDLKTPTLQERAIPSKGMSGLWRAPTDEARKKDEEKKLPDTEVGKLLTNILKYDCTFDSSKGQLKFERALSQLNDLTRKLTELEKNGVFKLISVGPIENEDVCITIHGLKTHALQEYPTLRKGMDGP